MYSFGVVLLELITGQPPAVPVTGTESIHIAHWVRQKLSMGNIENIVDRGWEESMMSTLSGKLQNWHCNAKSGHHGNGQQ